MLDRLEMLDRQSEGGRGACAMGGTAVMHVVRALRLSGSSSRHRRSICKALVLSARSSLRLWRVLLRRRCSCSTLSSFSSRAWMLARMVASSPSRASSAWSRTVSRFGRCRRMARRSRTTCRGPILDCRLISSCWRCCCRLSISSLICCSRFSSADCRSEAWFTFFFSAACTSPADSWHWLAMVRTERMIWLRQAAEAASILSDSSISWIELLRQISGRVALFCTR
mmetsp:Transcript_146182/g.255299  ORF Transcript_146182/g.255299 Transcript_146182/m.255299 type:complete len:226 (+) Transcript_146182:552-1229(+)